MYYLIFPFRTLKIFIYKAHRKLQQAVWTYIVSQMSTKEETNELIKVFKDLDTNGDGQLSKEELIRGNLTKRVI